jgi:ABC-type antimicrobial peptide transport system permease subunit
MDEVVRAAMSTPRFTGTLLAGFAALALTLASIGVYGVLSYAVSRRTREIGIRMAIGANRGDVMRMILTRGVTLALAGIAAGVIVAQWAVSLTSRKVLVRICAPPNEINDVLFWSCCRSNFGSPSETTDGMTAATTNALRPWFGKMSSVKPHGGVKRPG